jgi:putative ABC transport system permease protein
MSTLGKDVRQAARALRHRPGFTTLALLTLALGIGANTAVFSVVNAALLRPLPYPDAARLVQVGTEDDDLSPGDYLDVAAESRAFDAIAAYRSRPMVLSGPGEPERISAVTTTPGLIPLLGVRPLLGRTFGSGPDEGREALLGFGLWHERFGGKPTVVGEHVVVDGEPVTVVGVMPRGFAFPSGEELWLTPHPGFAVPEHPLRPLENPAADRGAHYFETVARLRAGVPLERARAELGLTFARIVKAHPDSDLKGARPGLVPLRESTVGDVRPALLALLGAVGLVLLIACVNVANLTLARGSSRARELAVREALGAGRGRLVRLLLTESALLVAVAAGLGGALAHLGSAPLAALLPADLGGLAPVAVDGRVLAFTLGLALLAAVLSGLWPALVASRQDPIVALKEGGRGGGGDPRRVQGSLVVLETALALVLLVGSGLLLKSLSRLLALDEGFRPGSVLTLRISLPALTYGEPGSRSRFVDAVLEGVRTRGGVESAAVVTRLPLDPGRSTRSFAVEGRAYPAERVSESLSPDYSAVSPGYFATLGIPLLAGRDFDVRDDAQAPAVAIVSRALARRCWPGQDPVGAHLRIGSSTEGSPWMTVVGVVGDVRQHDLAEDPAALLYVPYAQDPWTFLTLAVRGAGAPERLARAVADVVHRVDPAEVVYDVRSLEDVVSRSLAPRRTSALLLGLFATLAVLLAALGVFSVTSFAVARRTHEFGVRMALGASSREILEAVLVGGGRRALLGVGLGGVASLAFRRVLAHFLYGVQPTDAGILAAAAAVLVAVLLLASALPAWRAARVSPVTALRYE